jgi:hypothetical protein
MARKNLGGKLLTKNYQENEHFYLLNSLANTY